MSLVEFTKCTSIEGSNEYNAAMSSMQPYHQCQPCWCVQMRAQKEANSVAAQAAESRMAQLAKEAAQGKALAADLQKQLHQSRREQAALVDEDKAVASDLRRQLEAGQEQQAALVAELRHSQSSYQQLAQSVEQERAGMQHEAKLRKQLQQSVRLMRSIQGQNAGPTDMVRQCQFDSACRNDWS